MADVSQVRFRLRSSKLGEVRLGLVSGPRSSKLD